MNIKNREEVVEQLKEMLIQFAKDLNKYQTDIYAYYDEKSETVELDTFVNVGGNSWLDDDHITIYSDKESNEEPIDTFTTVSDIADALEINYETFVSEIAAALEIDAADVDWRDAYYYVKSREDYSDKINQAYCYCVDEQKDYYAETAEEIITMLENDEF